MDKSDLSHAKHCGASTLILQGIWIDRAGDFAKEVLWIASDRQSETG
jgi:hypothetical protein